MMRVKVVAPQCITRSQFIGLVACVALFVGINLYTLPWFPIVWGDEVMFSEPAANLAYSGNFVSRTWGYQGEDAIWAGNAPLYSLLLSQWIETFGLSIIAVRSFGILLIIVSAVFYFDLLRRLSLFSSVSTCFWVVGTALCSYGIAMNYRSGRYDTVGILLTLICAWSAFGSFRWRYLVLSACAALIPIAGLHLVVASVAACSTAALIFGRRALITILVFVVSLGFGGLLFLLSLYKFEVLGRFLYSIEKLKSIPDGSFPKDPSLLLLLMAAVVLTVIAFFSRLFIWDRKITFLWAMVIVVPATVLAAGRFPTYYSWMAIFSLCPLIGMLLEKSIENMNALHWVGRISVFASIGLTGLAVISGLPLQVASAFAYRDNRNYDEVVHFVAESIRPDDVVMVSPAAWYAAMPIAKKTYTTIYDSENKILTDVERCKINVVVVNPKDRASTTSRLLGKWQAIAELPPASRTSFGPFSRNFGDKLIETYSLIVLRRVTC